MSKDSGMAMRTDVVLPDRCSLQTVCPALDTVAESKRVVVFAENCAAALLDSADGSLRRF